MLKKSLFIAVFTLCTLANVFSQNDCPSFSQNSKFDTLTFIKTATPTDDKNSKVAGNIYLGQGFVKTNTNYIAPVFIPNNKPTWALAVAHAWNYHRNIIKRVNYPQIGYYLGTVLQETELACVTGTTWDSLGKESKLKAYSSSYMAYGGCYQIEGPGSGYGMLSQQFPINRFPVSPSSTYNNFVLSVNNFETSSLIKSYYDISTSIIYNYNVGWKLFESVDCTTDKYAYIKGVASAYNGGPNTFLSASTYFNHSKDNVADWIDMPSVYPNYGRKVAQWTAALENDINYAAFPTGSTFHSYYNGNITWSNVTDYLTIVQSFYPEIDFSTKVVPAVEAAYIKIAGSTSTAIAFMKLGPVIDQIILSLPAEYPIPLEGSPVGVNLNCSGKALPYGHFEIENGKTNLCLGESVSIKIVVDGGGGPTPTYKWFIGKSITGTPISTDSEITIAPTAIGQTEYTAQICNGNNCYQINSNASGTCDTLTVKTIAINTQKCSNCSTTILASAINTPCKGMAKGTINLTITDAPANYKISYNGHTSLKTKKESILTTGNNVSITDLIDGKYNIILEDLADQTCKIYASAIVNATSNSSDFVEAKVVSTSSCTAQVEAKVKAIQTPCKWTVQALQPDYFSWDNFISLGIATSTGAKTFTGWNKLYSAPSIFDKYSSVKVVENIYQLTTGDVIDLSLALSSAPGASQNAVYRINILNNADSIVKSFSIPAYTIKTGTPYNVGSYAVTCPYKPANYTFNWTPSINSQTDTPLNAANKSTGNTSIYSNEAIIYHASATNKLNTQCVYNDTLIVNNNLECNPSCIVPNKPIIISNSEDTICEGYSANLSVSLQAGKYYLWYKNNVEIGGVALNANTLNAQSETAIYTLRIADAANKINDNVCYNESESYTLTVVPHSTAYCSPTDIQDNRKSNHKKIVKVFNIFGQEIQADFAQNGLFIYLYNDGSTLKVLK